MSYRSGAKAALLLLTGLLFLSPNLTALEIDEAFFARSAPIFHGEESFRARLADRDDSRKPLGLLLSGGSARAYAHIGVLRRLEEEGIVPDFIVANSMGSIVGMLYAAGLSPDQIEELVISTPMGEIFQPVIPLRGGLMNNSRFMDLLYNMFGKLDIKDLPIPIIVVCDDLVSHKQVWMAEGDFYSIFRASFSMPVFFEPVPYESFVLVDGGTTNLVPVDVPATFTDRILVATAFYQTDKLNFTNPITIIHMNYTIAKERNAIEMLEKYRPLVVRCDVENISFMDYFRIKQIAERGYASTDLKMPQILEKLGLNPRDLSQVRAEMTIKKEATKRKIQLNSPFYRNGKRFFVNSTIEFPDSFHSPYHFMDDPYGTLLASAGAGFFGIKVGASSTFHEFEPAASVRMQIGPIGCFDISSYHQITKDYRYTKAALTGRFFMPYPMGWFPFIDTEVIGDRDLTLLDGYHRAGLTVKRTGTGVISPALSLYGFDRKEEIYGLGGEASLVVAPVYPLAFRTRAMGRYGLSGSDEFAVFLNDGYRGILPEGTSLPHAVFNGEIALNADKLSVGLAETLLIQRLDTALFLDVLTGDTKAMTAGLSLTGSISLIGLTPFTATIYGGYDLTADEPVIAFRAGALF